MKNIEGIGDQAKLKNVNTDLRKVQKESFGFSSGRAGYDQKIGFKFVF